VIIVKNYSKPEFEFVMLRVEERYAAGSVRCTVIGSCPDNSAVGCSYTYGGQTYVANQAD
jgi:hypothetical protein